MKEFQPINNLQSMWIDAMQKELGVTASSNMALSIKIMSLENELSQIKEKNEGLVAQIQDMGTTNTNLKEQITQYSIDRMKTIGDKIAETKIMNVDLGDIAPVNSSVDYAVNRAVKYSAYSSDEAEEVE